jgi:hypothetical protein
MTVAADLMDAANLAEDNLFPLWKADTLQAKVTAFWQAINPVFPDEDAPSRPIGAWVAIIAAFAPTILPFNNIGIDVGSNTIVTFQQAVQYIYRICKLGFALNAQAFITPSQSTALLAAYNAQFS